MPRSGTADGLYYELHDAGPDDPREVVVLSAGLGGSGAFWAPQMAALTARFRVLLYDHRGTARSARTLRAGHRVSHMADDIVAVLDDLGLAKVHLVGHAAGGLAGLALALDHPDRLDRLVVVNGWAAPDPHVARVFATRLRLLNDSGPEAYVHAQPLFLYPADWISENHDRLALEEPHHVAGFPTPEVMLARIQALLDFDIDARLPEITAPVLVSASADDTLVPVSCSRRLAARLPHATLDIVPWGGHGFTVTAPDAFNASLVAFLGGETR
ncbi:MAG TPA: pyrimidine utilization protein D [Caulobacter sp.]|nr:pyrimidine utilization protein D [Caulobacter sp.]